MLNTERLTVSIASDAELKAAYTEMLAGCQTHPEQRQWASGQPGVTRIEAETEPGNAASQRVLEKSGFVLTGTTGEEGPRFVWRRFLL